MSGRPDILGEVDEEHRIPTLGEIIRRQRELGAMSMRQFAEMVGISNPYLSQIERGLREPSEKVVEAIARNLDVSAEVLYRQAGLDPDAGDAEEPTARVAIRRTRASTPGSARRCSRSMTRSWARDARCADAAAAPRRATARARGRARP